MGIVPDVDLDACLFGGQSFTWWRSPLRGANGGRGPPSPPRTDDDLIEGVARGTHVRIDAPVGTWSSTPARTSAWLGRYLGARRTLPSALADDAHLAPLATKLPGLRLLEQDPWEGMLSFFLSPVNNVPRIQENIARLSRELGPRIGDAHGLPRPDALATLSAARLASMRLGFRGPRLQRAARAIVEGGLDLARLQRRDVATAREELLDLDGVGPKVAECILCYALAFDDAYPVDRWVARASERVLGDVLTPEQARERWGARAAMAQQLLFHGARMGLVAGVEASPMAGFDGWRSMAAVPAHRA